MDKPLEAFGLTIQEWLEQYGDNFFPVNWTKRCPMCGKETRLFERYTRTPLHLGECARKFAAYMWRAHEEGYN